mmetsp:Transcript_78730/g.200388  ORF Transcript_78730/g.200388 Transcript_78730/m.200388 type:complete len:229 (+) Transcript_78730:384-1070(+)
MIQVHDGQSVVRHVLDGLLLLPGHAPEAVAEQPPRGWCRRRGLGGLAGEYAESLAALAVPVELHIPHLALPSANALARKPEPDLASLAFVGLNTTALLGEHTVLVDGMLPALGIVDEANIDPLPCWDDQVRRATGDTEAKAELAIPHDHLQGVVLGSAEDGVDALVTIILRLVPEQGHQSGKGSVADAQAVRGAHLDGAVRIVDGHLAVQLPLRRVLEHGAKLVARHY